MQLFWCNAGEKQRLTVEFDNVFDFCGPISALCCTDSNGYTVNIYLNGRLLKSGVDFNAPEFKVKRIALGEGKLVKGMNRFEFEIVGSSSPSGLGHMGIDKVIFGR